MTTFVIRRLLWTIPVVLLVILFTFLMMRQIKGNPFRHSERAVPSRSPAEPREEIPPRRALVRAVRAVREGCLHLRLRAVARAAQPERQRHHQVTLPGLARARRLRDACSHFSSACRWGSIAALRANKLGDYLAMLVCERRLRRAELPGGDAARSTTSPSSWRRRRADERLARRGRRRSSRRSRSGSCRWRTSRGSCAERCSRHCNRTTSAPRERRVCARGASSVFMFSETR